MYACACKRDLARKRRLACPYKSPHAPVGPQAVYCSLRAGLPQAPDQHPGDTCCVFLVLPINLLRTLTWPLSTNKSRFLSMCYRALHLLSPCKRITFFAFGTLVSAYGERFPRTVNWPDGAGTPEFPNHPPQMIRAPSAAIPRQRDAAFPRPGAAPERPLSRGDCARS